MVIVIARFRPRPDSLDEFIWLLEDVQEASRGEAGCVNYDFFRSISDPMSFVAVEEWDSQESLEVHLRTEHVARLIAAIPEHAAEPPVIQAHTVSASGPLPLP
jgi:quinol monooxygenase YgiN